MFGVVSLIAFAKNGSPSSTNVIWLSEIAISKIEKMLIRTALEKSNGKKNDAAQILGWGRNTLSKKMKEHGI